MNQQLMTINKNAVDKRKLDRILIAAVLIRLLVLLIIVSLGNYLPALGFINNSALYDDYRYEQGAFLYSQKAKGIFDIDTFTQVFDSLGDGTGHNLSNPLNSTPLWYWICCVLVYITKFRYIIRLLNILLFTLSIKIVWKIANRVFGQKEAFLVARLMAFLPYFVVFSCFSYKDVAVMLCTFFLIWYSILIKRDNVKVSESIGAVLATIAMFLIRSGLIIVLLALLFVYLLIGHSKCKDKLLLLFPFCCIIGIVILYKFGETVLYKFSAYNSSDSVGELGLGRFVKITEITHIWKLPFTYVFSVLQPIHLFTKINSWSDLISNVNFTMIPIALGSFLYLFKGEKKEKSFFCVTALYYLISAVSSILVFRQLFSLLPIPIMYFSSIWKKSAKIRKFIIVSSVVLFMLLVIVFMM